jgi:hypothetical protein
MLEININSLYFFIDNVTSHGFVIRTLVDDEAPLSNVIKFTLNYDFTFDEAQKKTFIDDIKSCDANLIVQITAGHLTLTTKDGSNIDFSLFEKLINHYVYDRITSLKKIIRISNENVKYIDNGIGALFMQSILAEKHYLNIYYSKLYLTMVEKKLAYIVIKNDVNSIYYANELFGLSLMLWRRSPYIHLHNLLLTQDVIAKVGGMIDIVASHCMLKFVGLDQYRLYDKCPTVRYRNLSPAEKKIFTFKYLTKATEDNFYKMIKLPVKKTFKLRLSNGLIIDEFDYFNVINKIESMIYQDHIRETYGAHILSIEEIATN